MNKKTGSAAAANTFLVTLILFVLAMAFCGWQQGDVVINYDGGTLTPQAASTSVVAYDGISTVTSTTLGLRDFANVLIGQQRSIPVAWLIIEGKNADDILKIGYDGSLYYRGRLIAVDQELEKIVQSSTRD